MEKINRSKVQYRNIRNDWAEAVKRNGTGKMSETIREEKGTKIWEIGLDSSGFFERDVFVLENGKWFLVKVTAYNI